MYFLSSFLLYFDPSSHIFLRLTVRYSFDQFFNCTYHSFDPSPHTLHHPLRLHWLKAKEPFRASALGRAGRSRRGEEGKGGRDIIEIRKDDYHTTLIPQHSVANLLSELDEGSDMGTFGC